MKKVLEALENIAMDTLRRCSNSKQVSHCGREGKRRLFQPAGDEKYGSFWPVDTIFSPAAVKKWKCF